MLDEITLTLANDVVGVGAQLKTLIWLLMLVTVCALIAGIYGIKSSERVKREEQITRRDAIKQVSEGNLSVEDADKLINPKKRWFDK